jgi:phage gp29-like protein
MDLANESRQKDCHLQSVLGTSEESIAGLPWQLVPAKDALVKEKKAAAECEERLRATSSLPHLIAHLAGAVYLGRNVGETLWTKDGGKLWPEAFDNLAARRFAFRPSDGRLVWRDQNTGMPYEGVDFRALHPHKFIVSQPRVTGDIPQREGLCRPLIWVAYFRSWAIADWLRTAEISWKPWRIGTYQKGAADEDKDGLETVLRQLTTEGAGMIPETTQIKIEWPAGTTSGKATHAELCHVLAQEMSKGVLGQTETTQSSSGSGYAQAKVMDGVRKDLRESRARHVGNVLTRDVVTSMVVLNYDGVRVPRLTFVTKDEVDLEKFGKALTLMVGAGVKVPQKWALDQAGIPEAKDGEDVLTGTPEIPIDVEEPEEPGDGDEDNDGKPVAAPAAA